MTDKMSKSLTEKLHHTFSASMTFTFTAKDDAMVQSMLIFSNPLQAAQYVRITKTTIQFIILWRHEWLEIKVMSALRVGVR